MALSEGQYSELEKRLISFKAQFGITHTAQSFLTNEKFGKSYNIYPDDILTETNNIPFNLDEEGASTSVDIIKPFRTRTWQIASFKDDGTTPITDIREKIIRGNFEITETDFTDNPYIEKVIIPLTKVKNTGGQVYTAFGKEYITDSEYSAEYNSTSTDGKGSFTEVKYNKHAVSQSSILTNFLNPSKFGGSYTAQVFTSNISPASESVDFYQPNLDLPLGTDGQPGAFEGWVFDYKTGILLVGADGPVEGSDDLDGPGDDVTLNFPHPLWLHAYRYIGPTGFSHPLTTITASNIQVDNNVNIDGGLSFNGISFSSVDSTDVSGSSEFGSNAGEHTHKFTGSVFVSGGLFVNGQDTAGSGGGQSGINPFVFPSSLHPESYDYYRKTTIEPTNENDVIEFTSSLGLKISGSVKEGNFLSLLGSGSFNEITKSFRQHIDKDSLDSSQHPVLDEALASTIYGSGSSGGFLFDYSNNGPILTSFAPFTAPFSGSTIHRFQVPKPISIGKIGVYHSNNDLDYLDPTSFFGGEVVDQPNSTIPGVDTIELLGSIDGDNWVSIYYSSSIKEGILNEEYTNSDFIKTYTVNTDLEFPYVIYEGTANIYENYLNQGDQRSIAFHTSSYIIESTSSIDGGPQKYKYYELKVSGGLIDNNNPTQYYHYLHGLTIWENKNQGTGNRKHLTIAFDDTQDPTKAGGVSFFDTAIETSVNKLGITNIAPFPDKFNLIDIISTKGNITTLTSNQLTATGFVDTAKVFADEIEMTENGKIFGNQAKFGGSIYLADSPNYNDITGDQRSIILDSLNPIYFTNRKGDGTLGADNFSGRIFGHYNSEGGSDLYIDGYRLFNVADKEIRLISLAEEGVINLSSSKVNIQNDLVIAGNIDFKTITQNGSSFVGAGGGFPHNQTNTQITASVVGALKIEAGNPGTNNPHIILGPSATDTQFNQNKDTQNILHNFSNTLYWGNAVISTGETEDTVFENVTLAGDPLDLNSVGIGGTGNINITGNITATSTGSFGHLNATINEQPSHSISVLSLVYDTTTNQIHYTGSYGAGGTATGDDDWTIEESHLESSLPIKISNTLTINNTQSLSVEEGNLTLGGSKVDKFKIAAAQTLFLVSSSGNVGIGNITPTQKLVVGGNISASGTVIANQITANSQLNVENIIQTSTGTTTLYDTTLNGGTKIIGGHLHINPTEDETPSETLYVGGNIKNTGTINTTLIDAAAGVIDFLIGTASYANIDNTHPIIESSYVQESQLLPLNTQTDNTYITSSILTEDEYNNRFQVFNSGVEDSDQGTYYIFSNSNPEYTFIDVDITGITILNYVVTKATLTFNPTTPNRYHKQVQISGSYDGVNWYPIAEELSESSSPERDFTFDNSNPYRWYRMGFRANGWSNPDNVNGIDEIKYYGYTPQLANSFPSTQNLIIPGTCSIGTDTIVNGKNNLFVQGSTLITKDLHVQSHITSSGVVKARAAYLGEISTSLAYITTENADQANYSTVLIDTSTGKLYHTGSYGGGVDTATLGGTDNDWIIDSPTLVRSDRNVQIGNFTSGDKDSLLRVYSDGGDTYNNLSGIQFRHDTDLFGFTIQSQDGPAGTDTRHGLNIISYAIDDAETSLVNSRLFIDRVDGDIGIGTVNPNHKLDIQGTLGVSDTASFSKPVGINVNIENISNPPQLYVINDNQNQFDIATFEGTLGKVRLVEDGNEVRMTRDSWNYISAGDQDTATKGLLALRTTNPTNGSFQNGIEINEFGKVFLPNISGLSSAYNLKYNSSNGLVGYSASTRKVKKNISLAENSIYDDVLKLKPSTFNYKNPEFLNLELGFIAEEASEANPLFAIHTENYDYDESGNIIKDISGSNTLIDDSIVPSNINWEAITTALVGKIQSLEQRISDLENK